MDQETRTEIEFLKAQIRFLNEKVALLEYRQPSATQTFQPFPFQTFPDQPQPSEVTEDLGEPSPSEKSKRLAYYEEMMNLPEAKS